LLQGRLLNLEDLLPSEGARTAVREYCWEHLVQPDGNAFEVDQETRAAIDPKEFQTRFEDMRSWTVRQYDARLYFAKGTLLGNAGGHFECVIPFAAITPHVPAWQSWPLL
jgi:hypothetical protein